MDIIYRNDRNYTSDDLEALFLKLELQYGKYTEKQNKAHEKNENLIK